MRIPPAATMLPLDELGTVHLVGIGGAGLSAIARLLAQQGVRVQGSDAQDSVVLESLRAEGIECFDCLLMQEAGYIVGRTFEVHAVIFSCLNAFFYR